ncbi:MAG: entericidin A/B family lipoprotein [Oceanospirillaceae bacterium]|nr:entericidin A/B family lipoprotein [Oceanospirillaceae bacterium]
MRILSKIVLVFCMFGSLAACSTIEGIGKDLKKGGQAIENAANKE